MRNDKDQVSSLAGVPPLDGWNALDAGVAAQGNGEPHTQTTKKPYAKPSYRYEQVFETMALACGKINSTNFQCRFHRHAS